MGAHRRRRVPLFLLVGGTIASVANDDNALRHPGDASTFVATVVQFAAVAIALVAGIIAFAPVDPERNPSPIFGGGMTDNVPAAAPITNAESAPPAPHESRSVPEWWRQPASVLPSGGTRGLAA
jgi:hypothetical protein